jgi:hypothetical protein
MVALENESFATLAGLKATTADGVCAKALVVRVTCEGIGGPERSTLMRSLADDALYVLTGEERA